MDNTAPPHTVCMAVLPFDNLSGSADHDYFSSGFVEDLITDLSHFHNLQVISSYSSRKIGGEARNTLVEARSFDIDYLLKGNLQRRGDQLRINAQLLETGNGRVLWAERYDAPIETVFDIQDEILARVSGTISAQIDQTLLAAARDKPLTSLAAYDCWLRGMAQLREGTPEADRRARQIFEQAIAIDPHYSRAYAGLSLSYFNDWSCQVWEHWEETERNAYRYAMQAIELDATDHITRLILGRILLYRREFAAAEQHVDQSLALNPNDTDNLVQIAICKTFLGKAETGEALFLKALRLNPYRKMWYYTGGAFTYFAQRKFSRHIEMALKSPLTEVWVDLPAFVAAAHAHLGNSKEAARYLEIFRQVFHEKIITDHEADPEEIIAWENMANPFKREEDTALLVDGLVLAGLGYRPELQAVPSPDATAEKPSSTSPNSFKPENGMWHMRFEDKAIQLQEVKGFHDLARLMDTPGVEVHCTEMMGNPDSFMENDPVLDDKAKQSYEQRIRDLRDEIRNAEEMNDLIRAEKFKSELDQLTHHLAKALGIGRRPRKLNAAAERARAAVTWRLRSAIKKIEAAHPALGQHLANTIRTGTFCSYTPEKDQNWHL
jgi:TolB-like protein/tetratricopeptide (TPR) repeat protein